MEEICTVRGEITVPLQVSEIQEILEDINQMKKIDEYLKDYKYLETITPHFHIMQLVFKGILMISDRETVVSLSGFKFNNGMLVYSGVSVEHPSAPERKDPV